MLKQVLEIGDGGAHGGGFFIFPGTKRFQKKRGKEAAILKALGFAKERLWE